MYRYILANIKTYEPVMLSDEIDDIIKKLKYLADPKYYRFRHKDLNASGPVKDYVEEAGFFESDGYIIIDTEDTQNNSHLEVRIDNDNRIPYDELVSNIQQAIRNIKITKLLD